MGFVAQSHKRLLKVIRGYSGCATLLPLTASNYR